MRHQLFTDFSIRAYRSYQTVTSIYDNIYNNDYLRGATNYLAIYIVNILAQVSISSYNLNAYVSCFNYAASILLVAFVF